MQVIQEQAQNRTVTQGISAVLHLGQVEFQGYLSVIYFQWVEFFGIFSEVLRMPRIASFLFIQIQEVLNGIFFWWHLLQLVTADYSAHAAPGSEHPVSGEMEWEKRAGISYSSAISIPLILWNTLSIRVQKEFLQFFHGGKSPYVQELVWKMPSVNTPEPQPWGLNGCTAGKERLASLQSSCFANTNLPTIGVIYLKNKDKASLSLRPQSSVF